MLWLGGTGHATGLRYIGWSGCLSEKMKEDTFDYLKLTHSWVSYKGKGLNVLLP